MTRSSTTTPCPILISAGLGKPEPTKHVYSHSEVQTLRNSDGAKVTGLAHMFRCTVTGAVRRYGFERTFASDDGSN